jgi:CheY-like chemotaxis protein
MFSHQRTTDTTVPCQILIMDDHQDGADALAILLRREGHDVHVAYSAAAALELAETHHPDVFLLDLGMPELDGYTVAVKLRHELNFQDAMIIAVTGYGMAGDRARTASAGFDAHLTKPVDLRAILGLLPARVSSGV